ncbi:MAG: Rieske 2Fe-2S domain-containing protein [Pseudomonadota bacterium]
MYAHGWYQLAFADELEDGVTPLEFGTRPLIAIKSEEGIRVADAACPHRGAHLGFGGELEGNFIRCPFHHHRICIGADNAARLKIREYEVIEMGGMVFARLSDQETTDLPRALREIDRDYQFAKGFSLQVATNIEMVMENGFDRTHFKAVHGLVSVPKLDLVDSEDGALKVRGDFQIPRSSWGAGTQNLGPVVAEYRARAFSPGLVIAELQGEEPYDYKIITAAVPNKDMQTCSVRLSIALPRGEEPEPNVHFVAALADASREGLELDRAIWDHLIEVEDQFIPELDREVMAFAEFCKPFRAGQSPTVASAPAYYPTTALRSR